MIIVITGALYFADREMKTRENYFRGFPAVWNLAAFYLYILAPPPWVAAAGVLALAALTFASIEFVHPLRVKRLRVLNIALMGAWGALALVAIVQISIPILMSLGRFWRSRCIFSLPGYGAAAAEGAFNVTTGSSHRGRQPRHRRLDRQARRCAGYDVAVNYKSKRQCRGERGRGG